MNWIAELEKIKLQLIAISNKLSMQKTNQTILYETAKNTLGVKLIADEYEDKGCALALNEIHRRAFGKEIGGGASTLALYQSLMTDKTFEEVKDHQPGDVIISPTTMGNGVILNGHTGICGKHGIMSNTSANGIWSQNMSYQYWNAYYGKRGGFPLLYFRKVG